MPTEAKPKHETNLTDDDNDDQLEQEDQFEDATDELELSDSNSSGEISTSTAGSCEDRQTQIDKLAVELQETRVVLGFALDNEFLKALDLCQPSQTDLLRNSRRAQQGELYASLASATLCFLKAALTLEPSDLDAAFAAINLAHEVSSQAKRKSGYVARMLYRPNYNNYTDRQVHAELVQAEATLLLALISFLADQTIICLVRGAFRLRTCYQKYKECLLMLESRKCWQSPEAERHFEAGVRMGNGVFNLLMSYLPRRVLRLLEYVGFSGDRGLAVAELDRAIQLDDGLRSVFSALIVLTHQSYIENLFGLGHYEPRKVELLCEGLLGRHPRSAFFLLFRGRHSQMTGNLDKAIEAFELCVEVQDDWKQLHSVCYWEMMWCHAVRMQWRRAAHFADILRRRSKWSPASYTYQYATFLYAELDEEARGGEIARDSLEFATRLKHIEDTMRQVPGLRIRHAGKTIPAEKFAITRTSKFERQNSRLTLPALEFLYIWNIFATLKSNQPEVERILARIDAELVHIKAELAKQSSEGQPKEHQDEHEHDNKQSEVSLVDNWHEDLSLAMLLRGMCLKLLNRHDEAEHSFEFVVQNEENVEVDTFLVPHSAMELAVLKLARREFDDARKWIRMVRSDYSGYLHETMVHFKLHAAARIIRLELQDQSLANSTDCDDAKLPKQPESVEAS